MTFQLIGRTLVWLVIQAALLVAAAGTARWPGLWAYLIETGGLGLAMGVVLARRDPGLLAERMRLPLQRGQARWDRIFMACAGIAWLGWMILMALDVGRFQWSAMPAWLSAVGAVALAAGLAIVHLTFIENSFTAPVVRIQAERGHRVITSGPYRIVRHPMYAGMIPYLLGTALLLGSWWGAALVPLLIAGLAPRAVFEERFLAARLDGYADYAARVRWRLVPGIW
jgi:protein-S-isoprenylcysteine O-methyltransferase Ste14